MERSLLLGEFTFGNSALCILCCCTEYWNDNDIRSRDLLNKITPIFINCPYIPDKAWAIDTCKRSHLDKEWLALLLRSPIGKFISFEFYRELELEYTVVNA